MAGMLSQMRQDAQGRIERMADRTAQYRAGDISMVEQGLSGAATAVGLVGDPVGTLIMEAASTVTPDFVKRGLQEVASGVMNTDAVQYLFKLAEENPRAAAALQDVLEVGSSVVGGKAVERVASEIPNLPNAPVGVVKNIAQQAPNRQSGSFYSGGMLGKGLSVSKTVPDTLLGVIESWSSPQAYATAREVPVPLRKQTARLAEEKAKVDAISSQIDDIKSKYPKGASVPPEVTQQLNTLNDLKIAASKEYRTTRSYVEGQMDQQALLVRQAGEDTTGLLDDFVKAQVVAEVDFSPQALKEAVFANPQTTALNIDVDDEMLGTVYNRISNSLGGLKEGEKVTTFIRQPRAFSNIKADVDAGKQSRIATNISKAAEARKEFFGADNMDFKDKEDFLTFASMALMDRQQLTKFSKETGQALRPANKIETLLNNVSGEAAKQLLNLNTADSRAQGLDWIRSYYTAKNSVSAADELANSFKASIDKLANEYGHDTLIKNRTLKGDLAEASREYKKLLKEEKKAFNKAPAATRTKLAAIEKRLNEVKNSLTLDSKGRVYFGGAHNSSVKALGGVHDEFVLDPQGNVMTFISDENDLFGRKPIGHDRGLSVVVPRVYNIREFGDVTTEYTEKAKQATKQTMEDFTDNMIQRGATESVTGAGGKKIYGDFGNRVEQLAEVINKGYQADVTPADIAAVRSRQTGMLTAGATPIVGSMNQEEQQ